MQNATKKIYRHFFISQRFMVENIVCKNTKNYETDFFAVPLIFVIFPTRFFFFLICPNYYENCLELNKSSRRKFVHVDAENKKKHTSLVKPIHDFSLRSESKSVFPFRVFKRWINWIRSDGDLWDIWARQRLRWREAESVGRGVEICSFSNKTKTNKRARDEEVSIHQATGWSAARGGDG